MVQASAYRVSAALLAREDFRAACRERDFRTVFQLMRKYDGASQDRISSPVEGLTQSRVSRIMRGDDRVASLDLIERIVDSLQIPGSYVGLVPRAWETEPATDDTGASVTTIHPRAPVTAPGLGLTGMPTGSLATAPTLDDDEPPPFAPAVATHIGTPVGLRPHFEAAFTEPAVTIDFAGFSGETLAGALTEPLDKVRSGRLAPTSIRVRIMVPDTGRPWRCPARSTTSPTSPPSVSAQPGSSTAAWPPCSTPSPNCASSTSSPTPQPRSASTTSRRCSSSSSSTAPTRSSASTRYRTHHPHRWRHAPVYDLMGKDSVLFHHSSDDADAGSAANLYIAQAKMWFDSIWATVSQDYHRT